MRGAGEGAKNPLSQQKIVSETEEVRQRKSDGQTKSNRESWIVSIARQIRTGKLTN